MHATRLVGLIGFFFFNDTATTEICPLSLHDALPISCRNCGTALRPGTRILPRIWLRPSWFPDRKSTRLNSSHRWISYAVLCLTKNVVGFALEAGQEALDGGEADAADGNAG